MEAHMYFLKQNMPMNTDIFFFKKIKWNKSKYDPSIFVRFQIIVLLCYSRSEYNLFSDSVIYRLLKLFLEKKKHWISNSSNKSYVLFETDCFSISIFCIPIIIMVYLLVLDFQYPLRNRIDCVIVSVLVLSSVDRVFEPWLGQIKDYKTDICCFSGKHAALRRKNKGWLDNVSPRDCCFRELVL